MALRQYQNDLLQALRDSIRNLNKFILAVLPTGGGKTFTFAYLVKGAWEKGKKVLILTDRIELLTQAGGALTEVGLQPLIIGAGKNPTMKASLYVSMIETLAGRAKKKEEYRKMLFGIDILVIDEAHKRTFSKIFQYLNPECLVIGFTATPIRDGKKDQIGETYTDLVVGVEIEYLVNEGFLAKPNYYGVKADLSGIKQKAGDYDQQEVANRFQNAKLYKGVVENWITNTPNTKTLVFSSNIQNSQTLVREFTERGYNAKHIDSNMTTAKRKELLRWFKNEPNGILCNVGILTTGFDEPSIETIVLYRATKSKALYLQMVGRGSRVIKGLKHEFSVLDFGNNILTHGFWHEPVKWSLDVKGANNKRKQEAVLKNCKECEAFIPASAITCEFCGYVDVKEKKEQEVAELQLLDPRKVWKKSEGESLEKKAEYSKAGLIKATRVLHSLRQLEEVITFLKLMGYDKHWVNRNGHRYWWNDAFEERYAENFK